MIGIFADHPIHSDIYYRFHFKDAHEDSRMTLEDSVRDFKMYLLEESRLKSNNNDNSITVFLSTPDPSFNRYINTWLTSSNIDDGRLCINVDIDSVDIWYKWLVWLERKYPLYSMPSKSDLLNFLQGETIW